MINLSKKDLIKGIKACDRIVLSKTITLAESAKEVHRKLTHEILEELNPQAPTLRIGISGVPGVGKSTFIESFGNFLISKGHKVAVLTVDPSSKSSGGSILGDKTRMESLAKQKNAYIRPSPAGNSLGGVTRKTREAMLLCEAAGFDIILVETVGVGQSETAVSEMVDIFLLLMLAGAGDELQGIKKGIMEMADVIAINKADGDNIQAAKEAEMEYKRAVHLFPQKFGSRTTDVLSISSTEKLGIDKLWSSIENFRKESMSSGYFTQQRKSQLSLWFESEIHSLLDDIFKNTSNIQQKFNVLKEDVSEGNISPFKAAEQLIEQFLSELKK